MANKLEQIKNVIQSNNLKKRAKYLNSPVGLAVETVKGMPQAANQVARGTGRVAKRVVTRAVDNLISKNMTKEQTMRQYSPKQKTEVRYKRMAYKLGVKDGKPGDLMKAHEAKESSKKEAKERKNEKMGKPEEKGEKMKKESMECKMKTLSVAQKVALKKTPSKVEKKISKVMHEFGQGKLHSGSKTGKVVTNPKQAVAIGYSEGKKAKKKV